MIIIINKMLFFNVFYAFYFVFYAFDLYFFCFFIYGKGEKCPLPAKNAHKSSAKPQAPREKAYRNRKTESKF